MAAREDGALQARAPAVAEQAWAQDWVPARVQVRGVAKGRVAAPMAHGRPGCRHHLRHHLHRRRLRRRLRMPPAARTARIRCNGSNVAMNGRRLHKPRCEECVEQAWCETGMIKKESS
ncbi:hypothetical protein NB2BOR_A40990 [Bordetella parapertussis]|nr:hypothetical protein NB2BOR_A40990 [Bordetella parapertussis]